MASAAEQLAANLNFSALRQGEELKQRIWFTLGALIVYRLRHLYPAAGHRSERLGADLPARRPAASSACSTCSPAARIDRMAIFALNIMPYISASIIIQLMTTVSPTLEELKKEGEQGRKTINQYTRYGTVLLAAVQAYGIAIGLEGAGNVVSDRRACSSASRPSITLTGGTMFLMWLGEQITARGVGNGISLIILAGIVAELPRPSPACSSWAARARCRPALILVVIVMAVAVIAFIVFMERAQRRLLDPVSQAPGRQSHVRGRVLAPAAEAQYLGRDPADLRLVAAAVADDGRQFQRRSGPGVVVDHRPRSSATASRCS